MQKDTTLPDTQEGRQRRLVKISLSRKLTGGGIILFLLPLTLAEDEIARTR